MANSVLLGLVSSPILDEVADSDRTANKNLRPQPSPMGQSAKNSLLGRSFEMSTRLAKIDTPEDDLPDTKLAANKNINGDLSGDDIASGV